MSSSSQSSGLSRVDVDHVVSGTGSSASVRARHQTSVSRTSGMPTSQVMILNSATTFDLMTTGGRLSRNSRLEHFETIPYSEVTRVGKEVSISSQELAESIAGS